MSKRYGFALRGRHDGSRHGTYDRSKKKSADQARLRHRHSTEPTWRICERPARAVPAGGEVPSPPQPSCEGARLADVEAALETVDTARKWTCFRTLRSPGGVSITRVTMRSLLYEHRCV